MKNLYAKVSGGADCAWKGIAGDRVLDSLMARNVTSIHQASTSDERPSD